MHQHSEGALKIYSRSQVIPVPQGFSAYANLELREWLAIQKKSDMGTPSHQ
jgi:hypothetical protein